MKLKDVKRHLRIWWRAAGMNFSIISGTRLNFVTYVAGKILRMGFFVILIISLFDKTTTIVGYEKGEVLLFLAIMNILDILPQMIWIRGMTMLSQLVKTGDFDHVLVKPLSPLFWTAFRVFDFFDLTTLPIAILFILYAMKSLTHAPTLFMLLQGGVMLLLSLLLIFSITLILAAITFWTTENENFWWLYRDTIYVSRFPPEIFPSGIRLLFTFFIPILVAISFPTKALLGILSPAFALWAFCATAICVTISYSFWKYALRHYSSASA